MGSPPEAVAPEPIPWEQPEQPIVQAWIETVKQLVMRAVAFFQRLPPTTGNYLRPFLFALVCAYIGALLSWFYNTLLGMSLGALLGQGVGAMFGGVIGGALNLVALIILVPFTTAIWLLIATLILHLLLALLQAAAEPWEATYRVLAYAGVSNLANIVPFLGGIIGFLWGLYLVIVGLREVHRTDTGKAALAVLIPIAVFCLCVGFAALLGLGAFFGLMRAVQQG